MATTTLISNSDITQPIDLVCKRGDTFKRTISFRTDGVLNDLSGHFFRMDVRRKDKTVLLSFVIGDGITIENNKVYLAKTPEEMLLQAGTYSYDLEQTYPDGRVITRHGGNFIIHPDVTT